eukprot:766899-Hanusia_phi.AAC.5
MALGPTSSSSGRWIGSYPTSRSEFDFCLDLSQLTHYRSLSFPLLSASIVRCLYQTSEIRAHVSFLIPSRPPPPPDLLTLLMADLPCRKEQGTTRPG